MNWIKQLSIVLLFTSLTGSCFSLVWKTAGRRLESRDPKLLYSCLKIVMLSYLLPVAQVIMSCYDTGRAYLFAPDSNILLFDISPVLFVVMETMLIVFSLFGVAVLVLQFASMRQWRTIRNGSIPEEDIKILELFMETRKRLKAGKRIMLVRNDLLTVPVVTGIFHPVVILPCVRYTYAELEIILTHELLHYKRKDLWFKTAALAIAVTHCFNPLAKQLSSAVNWWSEVTCDIAVCEELKGRYSKREYFEVILKQILEREKNDYYPVSAAAEEDSEIIRRIRQMKNYKSENAYGKKKSIALLTAFTAVGLCLSLAASSMTVMAQKTLYRATLSEEEISSNVDSTDILAAASTEGLQSETMPENANVIEIPLDFNMWARNKVQTIKWNVGKDVYLKTDEIKLNKGDKVAIALASEPADLYIKAGLVYPDLTMKYAGGYGYVDYTFTITEAGRYRFYIHNPSKTTAIYADGSVVFVTSNY